MTNHITQASPHRMPARMFGGFFILAFVSYGAGSGMVDSVANADGLAEIASSQTTIVIGFVLMAVVHTFANIGLAVIMTPILKPINPTLAYGYYTAAIVATMTLIVGAIFMLLLLPLSQEYMASGDAAYLETLATLFKKSGFYSYQLGMTLWGLGGLVLTYLLFTSRLIPRRLSVWGFAGYLIFIIGTIAELFGYEIGLMLSAPGGLFEIALSFGLIIKGFSAPRTATV